MVNVGVLGSRQGLGLGHIVRVGQVMQDDAVERILYE
jgi:hypothetical protein